MTEIKDEVIKAYALENAIKYNGKASFGSVLSGLFSQGLEKSQIKEYNTRINEIINEINKLEFGNQKKEFEKLKNLINKREERVGLPELPNAKKGEVIMRFAPFPSGAVHLGNSRPLILNDEYAKKYDGKFLLIIDDTIGSEEKPISPESYKLIEEDARWLGCTFDKVLYKSDRIPEHYKYAEELIKKDYMYVCSCNAEDFRELKLQKKECPCRNNSPNKNLELWNKMFDKKQAPEGSYVVRLKTDMSYPDPAFRDRVMFKISDRPHPRKGTKFRVYPTMEFSWAIDNHYWKITHTIRGVELDIEGKVEEFIRKIFNWDNPVIINNGHLILEGIKLSKSKGIKEVKSGVYSGWEDPRLWSLQSLKARGIQPQAIREFIISQGVKKSNTTVPVDILYKINKKYIEESKRYFFVENPVKIKVSSSPELNVEIPLHPNQSLGFKKYKTTQEFLVSKEDYESFNSGNYRFMHLFNFKVFRENKLKLPEFSYISTEPEPNLNVKYLQWLNVSSENVNIEIVMTDGSIKKGLAEPEIKNLKEGEIIQFERFGFVKLNKKDKEKYKFFFTHK